jgi:WD40 repeat protein
MEMKDDLGGMLRTPAERMRIHDGLCTKRIHCWVAVGIVLFTALLIVTLASLVKQPHAQLLQGGELMDLRPEETIHAGNGVSYVVALRGGVLVTGNFNSNLLQFVDIERGESKQQAVGNLGVGGIAISPSGRTLAVAGNTNTGNAILQISDLQSRSLRKSIPVGDDTITSILFHPGGKYVYCECLGKDKGVLGVEISSGLVESVFGSTHHGTVNVDWRHENVHLLAVSPDGRHLVIGTWMRARIWNLQTATEDFSCPLSREITCTCAAVSPDGMQLATGGDEVEVWDCHTGKRIGKPPHGVRGEDISLKFSSDGRFLVAGVAVEDSKPGYLVVWRVADYSQVVVIPCGTSVFAEMCFLPGTNTLVTASSDGTLSVWDLSKRQWPKSDKNGDAKKGK